MSLALAVSAAIMCFLFLATGDWRAAVVFLALSIGLTRDPEEGGRW